NEGMVPLGSFAFAWRQAVWARGCLVGGRCRGEKGVKGGTAKDIAVREIVRLERYRGTVRTRGNLWRLVNVIPMPLHPFHPCLQALIGLRLISTSVPMLRGMGRPPLQKRREQPVP